MDTQLRLMTAETIPTRFRTPTGLKTHLRVHQSKSITPNLDEDLKAINCCMNEIQSVTSQLSHLTMTGTISELICGRVASLAMRMLASPEIPSNLVCPVQSNANYRDDTGNNCTPGCTYDHMVEPREAEKCTLRGSRRIYTRRTVHSIRNGFRLSHRVRVRVQTEPFPNWWSRLSINPNCQLGYGSKVNSQPI
jgi:hypothetical protein